MKVPEPRTLIDLLARAADYPATGLRFLDRRERPTFFEWSEIYGRSLEVAAGLVARGIKPGDRVGLIHPTSIELILGLFGAQLCGAVPVPLYPPVRLGRLDEYHRRTAALLQAAGARVALVDSKVSKLLGKTCERAALEQGFVTVSDVVELPLPVCPSISEDDLALVQFSSGTTVDPKPVALTHRAIVAQVLALNGFWPDDEEQNLRHSGVSWLPLYHDMGLIGCVFPALERPSVLTLIGPEVFVAKPAVWLRAVSRWQATISVAPNFAYGLCVEKIRDEQLEGVDLSRWRIALNGAEPVAPGVLRAFQERFGPWGFRPEALTPVYGLSEATLAVTFSELDRPFTSRRFDRDSLANGLAVPQEKGRELISVGRPLPGTKIRIQGPRRASSEAVGSEIGRILVKGPSVMSGYLNRPEITAQTLKKGWLDTGDLGFIHQGELFVHGRAKDVLILRGRNHSPVDVEQAVDGVPGRRTGCVVAVAHGEEESDREMLYLFVEAAKEATVDEVEAMPERCRERVLAATGLEADRVIVVGAGTLPRTSSGKLRRSETLRQYLDGNLHPPKSIGPISLAGEMLKSAVAYRRADRKSQRSSEPQ